MFLSHRQNAKQNHSINTTSRFSENVENFSYFDWTMTDKSTVYEETERRMNSENVLIQFCPESVLPFVAETHKYKNISPFYSN